MTRAQAYDRDQALDAALSLFWRKGFHATSLKDLEVALSMKPGSIYAAFSSKENLFSLALERYFVQNRDAFVLDIASAASPLAALVEYIRTIASAGTSDPQCHACMLVKTVLNATNDERAIVNKARQYLKLMEQEMCAAFEKAKALGELPLDLDTVQLARKYQSDITALRVDAHLKVDAKKFACTVEDVAQTYEAMRLVV